MSESHIKIKCPVHSCCALLEWQGSHDRDILFLCPRTGVRYVLRIYKSGIGLFMYHSDIRRVADRKISHFTKGEMLRAMSGDTLCPTRW